LTGLQAPQTVMTHIDRKQGRKALGEKHEENLKTNQPLNRRLPGTFRKRLGGTTRKSKGKTKPKFLSLLGKACKATGMAYHKKYFRNAVLFSPAIVSLTTLCHGVERRCSPERGGAFLMRSLSGCDIALALSRSETRKRPLLRPRN